MVNAGFEIVASVPAERDIDVVIGYKMTSIGESYVCWFCKEKREFFWGDYCSTYKQALHSMIRRLNHYYPGVIK